VSDTDPGLMDQHAPYPLELEELVKSVSYRDGWTFQLRFMDRGQGCSGLTLDLVAVVRDSLSPDTIRVRHLFPVPPAAYNRTSWLRWLLDRVLDVEQHEACEFFRLDGERVFAPHHSEGEDPYIIWMLGDLATAKKRSTDR
jgi:hypothetical protein